MDLGKMKNYDDRGSCFALSESYKASQNNALVRKPNSFILVVELTNVDDTDVQWHLCINFEQKTFDHVNYSFFSTWLAFEITGQSVSCFLALQSHHLFFGVICAMLLFISGGMAEVFQVFGQRERQPVVMAES